MSTLQAVSSVGIHFSVLHHLNKICYAELLLRHEYLGWKIRVLQPIQTCCMWQDMLMHFWGSWRCDFSPFSCLPFYLNCLHFFPFVSTWQIEQVYSTANARISWRVAHSFSSTHCSFNLSTLFCKFALEKMGFNICVDIKSFKCKGCNQHPEIWNGTRQCSVWWPGKQSAWLRGAWRGQVASALPCSKLSFSYNISNKCESTLKKNLFWGGSTTSWSNSSCMHLLFSVAYW